MKLVFASTIGLAAASQSELVNFDSPKSMLNAVFEDNHFSPAQVYQDFMNGRWCKTLDDFSYPLESDDWTYLEDKPVEKWCKMWRLCRIETKRRELSCNQVNYRNANARRHNQQKGFFADTNQLAYSAPRTGYSQHHHNQKVLAGRVCESDVNETPCLKKTCSCDLQLADKVLNFVIEQHNNYPVQENQESEESISFAFNEETGRTSEVDSTSEIEIQDQESESDSEEIITDESLDEKVQEIVQDHAVLVAEHSQLVEDIATFKEKVQVVVEEHAKSTMIDLKDTLAPIDDSLAVEEEHFEEASNTADVVLEELVEEVSSHHDSSSAEQLDQLEEMNDFALDQINEVGEQIEDMQAEEDESVSEDTLSDIAAFNQDFVFEDSITIKK